MKTTITAFLALILGLGTLKAEEIVLFRAILDMGDTKSFSLSEPSGAGSEWVEIGDYYNGWTVVSYDPETKTITLEQEGQTLDIPLATASGGTADDDGPAIAEATEVFRLMQFDEMIDTTMDQQRKAIIDMQRQMMEQSGQPVDEELLEIQASAINEVFDRIDWDGIKQDMINIYAETFSKDELNAFSDFYSTPAGKSLVEKQPEVQRRSMETMMPRMMAIGPEIQQSMQEKMQAYQAKKQAEAEAATSE